MFEQNGRKTDESHWDDVWKGKVRAALPSRLNVDVLNITNLLKKHVAPGSKYIEIGCAPGKLLAWVASALSAEVTGLDYSAQGIDQCHKLFDALGLEGRFSHEDFFNHTLPIESYDVVSSFGFIEHFDDPSPVVSAHLNLLRPGGVALMVVPNYGGIYGRLQGWADPKNLALHNLGIMKPSALESLANREFVASATAYPIGSVSFGLVNLDKRFGSAAAKIISLGVNTIGLLQPFYILALAPMLVLVIKKAPTLENSILIQ